MSVSAATLPTPQQVLVTGASGFVGRTLVPLLLQAGHRVTVLARDHHKLQQLPWAQAVTVLQLEEAMVNQVVMPLLLMQHRVVTPHFNMQVAR